MLKIMTLAALTLMGAATMTAPGCALFQGQRVLLEEMSEAEFLDLKSRVHNYGITAGSAIKERLTPEDVRVAEAAVRAIFASNQERGRLLGQFIEDPRYKALVEPAISAALDLLEASLGKPLKLESLGVTSREVELLEAILGGIIEGTK